MFFGTLWLNQAVAAISADRRIEPPPKGPLSEYRFAAVLALAVVVVGSLPYAYGYYHAGEGTRFMGFVGRGVFGLNGYLMLARQAQDGWHLFENLTTSDDVPRVFFNLEWWLFGKMARWTGLSLIAVFHIWRAASVVLFVFSAHFLLRLCLDTPFQRKFALALIALGSGFGWVLWGASKTITMLFPPAQQWAQDQFVSAVRLEGLLFPMPVDVTGVSVPAYLVNQPHFIRAVAFAALTYAFLLAGERTGRRAYFVCSGLAALLHAVIRPFNVPEMYLVFMLFPALLCLRDGRLDAARFKNYALAGLILLPMVVYYAYLAHVNAMGSGRPNWRPGLFVDHLLWLGLPFALMWFAFRGVGHLRTARPSGILLALWVFLAFLIEQAYPYYRTGQEAAFAAYVIVPSILAIGPMRAIYGWLCDCGRLQWLDPRSKRFKRAAATAVVVCCMPSFLIAYAGMFTGLRQRPEPHYISDDVYGALEWFEDNARRHDTVLASFEMGQLAPRIAGVKTYQGHYMITGNFKQKYADAQRFYARPGDEAFKRALVAGHRIRFVLLGPSERHANGFEPSGHGWLRERFSKGSVAIYEVVEGRGTS